MSKKGSLKNFAVTNPCSEDWEKMSGGDRVRFCSHCKLSVNNLSAMTRKEALKLVREANGRVCVRYVKNPKTNAPVFAKQIYQISRRASLAAGVLGASLTLSTLAYAQGGVAAIDLANKTQKPALNKSDKDRTERDAATVSGTITDPNGAVIPAVTVELSSKDGKFSNTTTSNDEGVYEFKNVPAGDFTIRAGGNRGFKTFVLENVSVAGSEVSRRDIKIDVSEEFVTVGEIAMVEFSNPLHRAVSADDIEQIRDLIAKGAGINAKDENYAHITPLFLAVENGNAEIAEMLLGFGAKANARNDNKQTPLMRLDADASAELARILIKHGAKINMKDDEGNTALIWAVENSTKPEVLQFLLMHGANLDEQNREGETALMKAAYNDNLEAVRVLLEAGANVSLKNKDGETALDLTGDDEIKKLLESYGTMKELN